MLGLWAAMRQTKLSWHVPLTLLLVVGGGMAGEVRGESGLLNRILVGDRFTECTGFQVEGWLDQGFTWNPASPVDRFNGPVLQNDRANEYQLNQLYLVASRPADTESETISFGFLADMLYGTDAFFFHSLGLDDKIVSDRSSRFYKLAIPHLYAEVFLPIGRGVTFQFGKWTALVGYETGLADEDYFYSKTIGFNLPPYTHTGILANFDLTDQISTSHGLHRGNDVWDDNNNDLSYTGSISWNNRCETTALTFAITVGPEQDERADFQDLDGAPGPDSPGENLTRVIYSLTLEQSVSEKLQYVINHDYFFQEGSETFGFENAEAYGVAQYLIYEFCERVSAGMRLEVYRDDDAVAGAGFRSGNEAAPGVFTNLTMGMHLRPCESMLIRPEIRWDWQDRDDRSDTPAFDAGTSADQFLFSTDAVIHF